MGGDEPKLRCDPWMGERVCDPGKVWTKAVMKLFCVFFMILTQKSAHVIGLHRAKHSPLCILRKCQVSEWVVGMSVSYSRWLRSSLVSSSRLQIPAQAEPGKWWWWWPTIHFPASWSQLAEPWLSQAFEKWTTEWWFNVSGNFIEIKVHINSC